MASLVSLTTVSNNPIDNTKATYGHKITITATLDSAIASTNFSSTINSIISGTWVQVGSTPVYTSTYIIPSSSVNGTITLSVVITSVGTYTTVTSGSLVNISLIQPVFNSISLTTSNSNKNISTNDLLTLTVVMSTACVAPKVDYGKYNIFKSKIGSQTLTTSSANNFTFSSSDNLTWTGILQLTGTEIVPKSFKIIATDLYGNTVISNLNEFPIWSAKNLGLLADGTDQTSKLQTALNRTDINTVWFCESGTTAYTINGTVTVPAGKTLKFETGNKLTGTGTINGGIIDASFRDQIFDTTLSVNPNSVSNIFFSIKWFGAIGDGATDDYAAIQSSINCCIKNNLQNLKLPLGSYKITQPLIFKGQTTNFFALNFEGETSFWGTGTEIAPTFKDTFAIGIQLGKGVRIAELYILGLFTPPTVTGQDFYNLNFTSFVDASCRDSQFSPYSGIVIDPFTNSGLPSDGGYPGLSSYYNSTVSTSSSTGSTGITIENCSISNFVIGICSSPNGVTQNAELTDIKRCQIKNVKLGISGCQSQEKANRISDLACWGGTHTLFATGLYGSLNETGNWFVDTLNISGGVNRIIYNVTSGWFESYFKNIYAEEIGQIGIYSSRGATTFENSIISFATPNEAGYQVLLTTTTAANGNITNGVISFRGCNFEYYGSSQNLIFSTDAKFESCSFSGLPVNIALHAVNTDYQTENYQDCAVMDPITFLGNTDKKFDKSYIFSNSLYGKTFSLYGNYTITDTSMPNDLIETVKMNYSSPITIQNFDTTTVTISGTGGSFVATNYLVYNVGQLVMLRTGYFDFNGFGEVSAIDSSTGTITLINVTNTLVTGSYYIFGVYPLYFSGTFMGDITGPNTISNIAMDWGNGSSTGNLVGHIFKSSHANTQDGFFFIESYDSGANSFTTYSGGTTFPNNITACYFECGAEKSLHTSSKSSTTINSTAKTYILYKGEKISQQIYSDEQTNYVITQTGYNILPGGGETRQATWSSSSSASSYDTLPLSTDGIYNMSAGDVITAIVIDSTTSYTLSIGSTVGGNDIANSLNIVGGTPNAVSVLIYAKTSQTIYFTGITGSTSIKIVKNSA